ncbi:MAG TPA: neutral/alkaline non-lysosomal ceramidase N-terminal domain-containing protein [Verrucomicrobiae bacterium]|nr:neutral/alkaline non-lysosomal ceramidase N-terminal domain-containing protein [Verrucomicrobiae bacterium]
MNQLRHGVSLLLGLMAWVQVGSAEAQWRAGIARQDITPAGSIWMGGYASRDHSSEGVLQPLSAKALILEDQQGSRMAFVCMDLIGVDFRFCEAIGRRTLASTGIARERIVFNSSHTHCGPVVAGVTPIVYDLDRQQQAVVDAYAEKLKDQLVILIETAVKDLRPADLSYGEGKATFGANRRAMRGKKDPRPDPTAPCDHGVPVMAVRDCRGELHAVLFGYACHGTTTGIYQINGDYPGYAQVAIETGHRGVTALFMAGCGGDINPYPRGEIALTGQHGQALAAAVEAVLSGPMRPLRGPLHIACERIELKLADPPGREELEQALKDKSVYRQRLARHLLAELSAGRPLASSCPCTVQVARFGEDLAMIAMPGEPVIDYALRLRRELSGQSVWVPGYCNEIFAYLPTERVLKEGGYEGGEAMVYFGLCGPFQPGLEQKIIDAVKRLAAQR